jgi:putative transposase
VCAADCAQATPEHAWLREVNAQLLQQAIRDLDRAFVAFSNKQARYPRFKSKKRDAARFRIPQRIRIANGCVVLPGLGPVKLRQSREPLGTLKSATCKQDATGRWYVTLVERLALTPPSPSLAPNPARVLGVDRGLKDLVVGTDGLRVSAPRWYRQSEHKLRRANRALSRTHLGSRGRQQARQRLALVHQKIRNRRADFLHELTSRLVRGYDGFCLEDLNTRGLARTKLAKSVLDAA